SEPAGESVRTLRRPQRKAQQRRHTYQTRSTRERRRSTSVPSYTHNEESVAESDSEVE
ncbi:hypothetical protein M9458_012605, partial [Cirrhinus mrigala]